MAIGKKSFSSYLQEEQLKFLFDVGVGKKCEEFFIGLNEDVKTVRSINPSMGDIEILELAQREERIVVTMDKDFGELAFHSKFKHSGILLLRIGDLNGSEKVEVLKHIYEKHRDKLKNNFCVYQNALLRVKEAGI